MVVSAMAIAPCASVHTPFAVPVARTPDTCPLSPLECIDHACNTGSMNQNEPKRTFRLRRNVGTVEALLRVFAGLAILGVGLYYQSWWGLIGLIPLLTGILRYCPVYTMLGKRGVKPGGPVNW